jgi:hypothetical protein
MLKMMKHYEMLKLDIFRTFKITLSLFAAVLLPVVDWIYAFNRISSPFFIATANTTAFII